MRHSDPLPSNSVFENHGAVMTKATMPDPGTTLNAQKGIKGFVRMPLEQRFWEKVDRRGPGECWPWTGSSHARGYGQIWINGRLEKATRVSWSLQNGKPFPSHLHACHACDNPNCVNPSHIWPGTASDNMKDAAKKGRLVIKRRGLKDASGNSICRNGHRRTPDNTYMQPAGRRICLACTKPARKKNPRPNPPA